MKALFKTLLYAFSTLFLFTHCTNKEKRGKSFVFTSDTVYINKYWDIDNLVFEQSTIADFEIFSAARPIQFNKTDPYSPPPLFMYDDKMTNPITKQKKYTNVYSSGFRFWNASIENDEGCGFHFGLTWAGDPDIDIEHNAMQYVSCSYKNGIF